MKDWQFWMSWVLGCLVTAELFTIIIWLSSIYEKLCDIYLQVI